LIFSGKKLEPQSQYAASLQLPSQEKIENWITIKMYRFPAGEWLNLMD